MRHHLRADVLLQLETGPQTAAHIAAWLEQPVGLVLAALERLAHTGDVHQQAGVWSLGLVRAPQTARVDRPRELRQPRSADTTGLAWWVGLPREQFAQQAAARQPVMKQSKFGGIRNLIAGNAS